MSSNFFLRKFALCFYKKGKHFNVTLLCFFSFEWSRVTVSFSLLTYFSLCSYVLQQHAHTYYYYMLLSLFLPFFINVIALSKQLVHFLMVWKPSEVVFASKSSFYPAIHWDLSDIIIFFFFFVFTLYILIIFLNNKHVNILMFTFTITLVGALYVITPYLRTFRRNKKGDLCSYFCFYDVVIVFLISLLLLL